jgi:hypothetical protein
MSWMTWRAISSRLVDNARHVIGCLLNQKARVHNELDDNDVARDICPALARGLRRLGEGLDTGVPGRGLHSSTSPPNLSRFWSLKPQQASTSQLNLRRFCRCHLRT